MHAYFFLRYQIQLYKRFSKEHVGIPPPPPFFQWPLITEYVIESSSKLAPKFKEKSKYIPAHAKYEMLALLVNQHPKQEPAQYTY